MEELRIRAVRIVKVFLFSAAIIPSLLGGAIAYSHGSFDIFLFLIVILGVVLGQAGGDYLYYYFVMNDPDSVRKSRTPFRGWRPFFAESALKSKNIFYAGLFCLGIDFVIAIYIAIKINYIVFILACIGGLIAYFFTPLMNRGFKEPAVFLAFGPLPVVGVYYVMTKTITIEPIIASISIGFLVTAIAYVKGANYVIDNGGRSYIIVKLGRARALLFFILAYLSIVIGVVLGIMPVWTLISLLTVPLALSIVKVVDKKYSEIPEYMFAVIRTIATHSITGILICIGYLIPVF